MPLADWGIDPAEIDDFDRESQITPYKGKQPPDGVYRFKVKVLKYAARTKQKNAQLRVGLELTPRSKTEKPFKGFFVMAFLPIAANTLFRYVPFLDAIGVSSEDFTNRTKVDENGDIKKIGKYRQTGDVEILAHIKLTEDNNGKPFTDVKWFGAYDPDADEDYDDEDDDEDDYDEDEED